MKVVCKVNNLHNLSDEKLLERLKKYIHKADGRIDIEIGREYTVYGVIFRDNRPWYYLCSEDSDEYPVPFAAELFSVSDDRLSSYWKLSAVDNGEGRVFSALVFNEWAKYPSFYERLLDGDSEAEALFAKYRQLMNQE